MSFGRSLLARLPHALGPLSLARTYHVGSFGFLTLFLFGSFGLQHVIDDMLEDNGPSSPSGHNHRVWMSTNSAKHQYERLQRLQTDSCT
ncbi:uncharacterized protein BJ212DRAFT_1353633 [Suillus subaureus]|uniref:Uncharacterized protein n=1 Tax=Suillus subaureus TaxID=48587 RepID=A0A9P7EC04_9AGAM|nr:uncharacterized protein BJ212DRAFT_1353633 [Suillus subaureus]KAG1816848.1 hypothetical protein BJ212DRAFT_1353633 [Suillus subaureus]